MASYRPARPTSVPEWRPRTHVSFRITLPPSTYASTVDVVGSWDDYGAAVPLEQDRRVGRDVWKTILTLNGGLEMGSEHYYYFLLDRKHPMPDPQSPPSSLAVHPRTGRLISVLFVPVELPPTPEPTVRFRQPVERLEAPAPSPSIVGSSVFADFDGEGDDVLRLPEQTRTQPHPQQPRQTEYHDGRKVATFRERLRARRSFRALPGPEDEHKPKRRRGWGLQLGVSTAFLRMGYKSAAPDETDSAEHPYSLPPQRDERATADIADYLRSDDAATTPKASCCMRPALATKAHSTASSVYSQNPDQASLSPGMYSSFYSSEDDEDDELATPVDVVFPRPYNFGELKGGATAVGGSARSSGDHSSVPSLERLREHMAWRDEIVGEHGYLSSVVV